MTKRALHRSTLAALAILTVLAAMLARPSGEAQASTSQVVENQTCVAGKSNVSFSWQGNDPAASQQWIDLTLFDNGWQDGTYISAGPLSGRSASYLWAGLQPKTQHYIRVNQQLPGGAWDPSGSFVFTTIDCGASVPTTSGGLGTSYTLLGFSDHTSSGGPPSDIVPPGGTLKSCNPRNLFAFIRVDKLSGPKDLNVSWFIGSTPIPRGTITLQSSGPLTLTWGFDQNTSSQTSYGVRLASEALGTPELQGMFSLVC